MATATVSAARPSGQKGVGCSTGMWTAKRRGRGWCQRSLRRCGRAPGRTSSTVSCAALSGMIERRNALLRGPQTVNIRTLQPPEHSRQSLSQSPNTRARVCHRDKFAQLDRADSGEAWETTSTSTAPRCHHLRWRGRPPHRMSFHAFWHTYLYSPSPLRALVSRRCSTKHHHHQRKGDRSGRPAPLPLVWPPLTGWRRGSKTPKDMGCSLALPTERLPFTARLALMLALPTPTRKS